MNDLKFALRQLLKNPGFTAVAVLTLALGLGVNTAIFSVINGVLLRPLPYPDPQQLVLLAWQYPRDDSDSLRAGQFKFLRDHNSAFQAVAGSRGGPDLDLKTGESSHPATALRVSADFFRVLGVHPALGRTFLADEERLGAPGTLVLSDRLWKSAFGGDREIIGRQVTLNGGTHTIIGILPSGCTFAQPADVFIPLRLGDTIEDKGMNTFVIARLKPGISLRAAQAGMEVVFDQYRKAGDAQPGEKGVRLIPYQEWLVGDVRPSLLLLSGAVGLLLLLACANVAGLVAARTAARQREIAVRLALGASRAHLMRQFLSESLILGLAGGAAGLLGAVWAVTALVWALPWELPFRDQIGLDAPVLLFTLFIAAGSSVALGWVSLAMTRKVNLNASLKEGGAGAGYGTARTRLRNLLVIAEVAVSVMLLIGAGLLIESLYRLHREKLGFETRNVFTINTRLSRGKYPTAASVWNFLQPALERVAALPGARSAAVVNLLPLRGLNNLPTQHEGHPEDSIGGMEYRVVSPDYFSALGIPLLRGRRFSASDTPGAQPVAIINETVARRWWPNGTPIGDRVVVGMYQNTRFSDIAEPPKEIIGIVGDVKGMQLSQPAPPTVYVPAAQVGWTQLSWAWIVRTSGRPPLGFMAALREVVAQVDPGQRVESVLPMSEVVSQSVARPRFTALLMAAFAGLALALTAVGLYGLISYFVTQRTREIGVRLALGAQRSDVLGMVIGQGMRPVVIGVGLGVVAALALTRFLRTLLYGVEPTEPVAFLSVALLLAGVALLACWLPARRAAKIDPMEALRYE